MSDFNLTFQASMNAFCEEMGLGKDVYLTLITSALKDMDHDLEELREAIDKNELGAVQQIAHRFKGTSSNLRLDGICPYAAQLNDLSRNKADVQKYPALLASIEKGVRELQEFLKQ